MSTAERLSRLARFLLPWIALATLAGCERPPIAAVQTGYRGTAMDQIYNPRTLAQQASLNAPPAVQPAASADGPRAKDVYKNLKVLGDLSVGEFTRNMVAITAWVAPQEGCAYCHNVQNLADDGKYTKVVARRMIQMTQRVNGDWQNHVGSTGVTCYTCHRGKPVPAQVWFAPPDRKYASNSVMGDLAGQNLASPSVGLSSLPFDPYTPYLMDSKPIRVNGNEALKFTGTAANRNSTKQAEHTYGLMVHMSNALGVNCTYCHNTRAFQSWAEAPPYRTTAYYGIRMARELNNDYLVPLTSNFPANRLGPKGDVAKVNCATCHQGAYKPLNGAAMAKDHPELLAPVKYTAPAAAAPAAPAVAAPAAAVVATAPAAAPTQSPTAAVKATVLYFGVGSAVLDGEQSKTMSELIAAMNAAPTSKASISGYHSASGQLAANQDLAKRRAFSVRDALVAAGIAADRAILEKPVQAEANPAGEDASSRRVEVTLK